MLPSPLCSERDDSEREIEGREKERERDRVGGAMDGEWCVGGVVAQGGGTKDPAPAAAVRRNRREVRGSRVEGERGTAERRRWSSMTLATVLSGCARGE